jgi:3-dehydroquinate dehydratase/shikimate dehydrogenase
MKNVSLAERVCESFYAERLSDALIALGKLQNMGELRFDLSGLGLNDLEHIITSTDKELIFTCRTPKVKKLKAIQAYQKAIDVGFQYIDIDFFIDGDILPQLHLLEKTRLILSFHNHEETPPKKMLTNILDELKSTHPHLAKLASFLKTEEDLQVLEALQSEYNNVIVMGMGERAVESRIRSIRAGAAFTYIALNKNQSTAQGQVDYKEFQEQFIQFRRAEEIKLAVLGNPIAHSKSPELFKNLFLDEEIKGVYEKMELEDIQEFEMLKKHYDGFNVTAPFKQNIIPFLDDLSRAAKSIGAVNTIYQKEGKWIGDNTDYKGIIEAINSATDILKIESCLIIGAGGAARAAAYAMNRSNINSTIINRTISKAAGLAQEFNLSVIEKANLENFQLIINTVPEPFYVINPDELNSNHIVLDAIYPNSHFERYSSEIGFLLIRGEVWLEKQALEAFWIFQKLKDD